MDFVSRRIVSRGLMGIAIVSGTWLPVPSVMAQAAEPYPELMFHAAPKPLPAGAVTEDWPGLLGSRRDGVSSETRLMKDFSSGAPKLVWEMTRQAGGYAPPSVVGDRVVFFHRSGDREVVDCLEAGTGKRFWRFEYPTAYEDPYQFGNGPRCAPSIDAGRVYTLGVEGKLNCLDLKTGEKIWHRDLRKDYKIGLGFFGVSAAPLVEGDKLIVNVGAAGGPCVVAFDKLTGKEMWRAGDQWGMSYAAPMAAKVHGKRRVFVFAGGKREPTVGGLLVIDPENGTIETRFPFRGKRFESCNAANPVVFDNKVFVTSTYGTGGALLHLKPGGGFDVAWKSKALLSHFSTPIYRDGHLYGLNGHGKYGTNVVCLSAGDGKLVWKNDASWKEQVSSGDKKLELPSGIYRGSLLYADGAYLALGEDGHLLWLDLSPKGYRELARTALFRAKSTWSPPALSRGLLFVAQNEPDDHTNKPARLLCYDLRGR